MEKLEEVAPALVSAPGVPLVAAVEALAAPAVIVKGEGRDEQLARRIILRNNDHAPWQYCLGLKSKILQWTHENVKKLKKEVPKEEVLGPV